tara:strand:+ start:128 stop:640 length:513 start_codon:yes stop_codon:yes gene_type:complete
MEEHEMTYDFLMRSGVKAVNLIVAGFGPHALKERGVQSAMQLRQIGFDALHLVDPDFCNQASMAFGSEGVKDAFLASAADAVALAGSEAMHILNISTVMLLQQCAGYPGEAIAVLQQLPQGNALHNIPCAVILDAGLRADTLKRCGYGLKNVLDQVHPAGVELSKLGYTV